MADIQPDRAERLQRGFYQWMGDEAPTVAQVRAAMRYAGDTPTHDYSDPKVRALNHLVDAVAEVIAQTGWDRDALVRYVEGCIRARELEQADPGLTRE